MFKKPFDYKVQRISRTYYWVAWGIWNILSLAVIFALAMEYQHYDEYKMNILFAVVLCIHFIYLFFLTAKRFHDVGKSTGYCVLCILLIPLVIGEVLIFLTCLRKSDSDNKWGTNGEVTENERSKIYYAK